MIRKNIFSISVGLLILILSLAGADKFQKIDTLGIKGIDKIAHFLMYLVFMSVILFENRKRITVISRVFIMSMIPACFGLLMELLQSWVTVSRSGSIYDLLFNLSGILLSILIFWFVWLRNKNMVR
jgi:VanZ family protein